MTRSYAPECRGAPPGPPSGAVCGGRPAPLMAGAAMLLAMAACRTAPEPEQVAPPPVIESGAYGLGDCGGAGLRATRGQGHWER